MAMHLVAWQLDGRPAGTGAQHSVLVPSRTASHLDATHPLS